MNAEPKRRLFVAIELTDPIRAAIDDLVRPLRSLDGFRWVLLENLHLTLAFLGWVEADVIEVVEGRVAAAAAQAAIFRTHLSGLGRFPDRGKARVLWVGFEDASGSLAELAGLVQGSLGDLYKPENRPFRPHVTIARARRPVTVRMPAAAASSGLEIGVGSITLFRSHLGREHARYEVLQRFGLGAQPAAIP